MPNLNIVTSNRLEVLSKALAEHIRIPLLSPLEPEIVVVQSRGMQRWVSLELARHNGICANVSFPFPNTFLKTIIHQFLPDYPEISLFDPSVMMFRIMEMLPLFLKKEGFESLKTYLKENDNGQKLFQLSEKISNLFDQYLVFRSEMISQWEAGKANHWQAQLWRALTQGQDKHHRVWLQKKIIEKFQESLNPDIKLPQRVSVFGISYLPHQYLYSFAQISHHIEINFFLMNPSKEYWMDIVTHREMKTIRDKYVSPNNGNLNKPLHLDQGNRLIASMGMMGRDFFHLVYGFDTNIDEQFEEGETDSLLACIQSDILNLEDRPTTPGSYTVSDEDASIEVHACHSPMREIEILYDHLLSLFEKYLELLPKDILVMTPDIETYAPYIHAIFEAQTDEVTRIPYYVADRNIKSQSPVISGFMSLLELKDARITASQIMDLLEISVIRETYDLHPTELEILRFWIRDTHIRWGIDAEFRQKMGLPALPDNTWKSGIQRLLLGYVIPGKNRHLYQGILPYDPIEGDDGIILGKFLDFMDKVFLNIENLNHPKSIKGWCIFLHQVLEDFFPSNETTERDIQLIRHVLNTLLQYSETAGFSDKLEFEVIRAYLDRQFKNQYQEYGFLAGGVTFCAMLPMRSIPAKVICLIGMNTDSFPRKSTSLGFDYISRYPKPGDRSRRNDDKYLFLESLISTRSHLYISYVGQSIQDNSRIPPSPLVSELLDYISDGFGIPESRIVTYHRLSAFSPRYFSGDDRKLFSYSRENLLAATRLLDPEDPQPIISEALSEPPVEWKRLTIDELISFFCHPVRYFLEKRLGIIMREKEILLDETENFTLGGLEEYAIGQELLHSIRSGMDLGDSMRIQKASGKLPQGAVGEVIFREMGADVHQFSNKISNFSCGNLLDSRDVHFKIADFHLTGCLQDLYETGQIRIRYGNKNTKDLLHAWIYHLIFNVLKENDLPTKTILICKDSAWEFHPLNDSEPILEHLLKHYWKGLTAPLHFFPESSFAFADAILNKHKDVPVSLNAANRKWQRNDFGKGAKGESEDPYHQICFKETDPMDHDFQQISLDVFSPMFKQYSKYYL